MPQADRSTVERDMLPKVGASFFRDDEGDLLFQFVVDTTNIIGPRPATRSDQERHEQAWAAFAAAEGLSALDRDGKDGDGGSLVTETPAPAVPVDEPATPRRKYSRRKKA